ncbi:Os05g0551650 [Oryza sativa Japonica Group]|uniref:Os05g0551650 protein n=1 Tax=Oryza sativa subsp. japonica TaxID=39947 RepID=A0A0P0WQU0_ORYSJ|nr:hypothetical protein EE612_031031 [Oryza sativa]BAS95220.1 Os05g0551650 [Oryza sativa Japonica Group]
MVARPGPRTSRSQEADSAAEPARVSLARTVSEASRRWMGQPQASDMRRILDTCAAARTRVLALMSSIASEKVLRPAK